MPAERGSHLAGHVGVVAWLLTVWLLLWGRLTPVVVLGGLLVSIALTWGIRLPQVRLSLRPRPVLLLAELGRLVGDIAMSTAALAWAVLRTGPATRSALVRVPVHTPDDGLAVLVAAWVTLTPGSLVVELDPVSREVMVHVVPAREVSRVSDESSRLEARLLRALGVGHPGARP